VNDATRRFSARVENYARHRLSYPPALIATLQARAQLTLASTVVDLGSGTGTLTALLLPAARRVYAVEPNAAMRTAAEEQLGRNPGFTSVAAVAEATTLDAASADLITVAQAFHWFDRPACRREFLRILRPAGQVALIWNERQADASPFLADYERHLQTQATGYDQDAHSRIDEVAVRELFWLAPFERIEMPNDQSCDLAGLAGRALSSSSAPTPGQPGSEAFQAGLEQIFLRHA
jgi:SAM-dependent methyltransferase